MQVRPRSFGKAARGTGASASFGSVEARPGQRPGDGGKVCRLGATAIATSTRGSEPLQHRLVTPLVPLLVMVQNLRHGHAERLVLRRWRAMVSSVDGLERRAYIFQLPRLMELDRPQLRLHGLVADSALGASWRH